MSVGRTLNCNQGGGRLGGDGIFITSEILPSFFFLLSVLGITGSRIHYRSLGASRADVHVMGGSITPWEQFEVCT